MTKQLDSFKKIISHAKEYGFIFPSSEIYDGLSAVYDYGQNGVALKNNIREYWWKAMIQLNENIVGIDSAIFMHPTTWKALWSVISALVLILFYISVRFEFKFALGAILALVHDVVITLGVFSLTGYEITLSTVAAFLTIVGYSLNDTIVILDRIRENMKSSGTVMFESTINKSINQSLSRTLITSLTTLLVIMVLLLYGGEVIQPFSFTMLVGVIIGTYSSIYIASALLAYIYQTSK